MSTPSEARATYAPCIAACPVHTDTRELAELVTQGQYEKAMEILLEANRLLMPEGMLLLDLPNKDYVIKNFIPESWHEANDDIVVFRQRRLEEDVLYSREKVISKSRGDIRDQTYCTRLYSEEKIAEMLACSGFSAIHVQKDYMSHENKGDYGCMTNRMIVIGHKR